MSWQHIFDESSDDINHAFEKIKGKNYRPTRENLFTIFDFINPEDIRVIICPRWIPKPQNGEEGISSIPFDNIYGTIKLCGALKKYDVDIYNWIEQGVFLFYPCVTSEDKGNHFNIWSGFTYRLFEFISEKNDVILATDDRDIIELVQQLNINKIVEVSSFRNDKEFAAMFAKINAFLGENNPIKW